MIDRSEVSPESLKTEITDEVFHQAGKQIASIKYLLGLQEAGAISEELFFRSIVDIRSLPFSLREFYLEMLFTISDGVMSISLSIALVLAENQV